VIENEKTGLESEHFYKVNTCNMGGSRPSSLTEYVNIHIVTIEKSLLHLCLIVTHITGRLLLQQVLCAVLLNTEFYQIMAGKCVAGS